MNENPYETDTQQTPWPDKFEYVDIPPSPKIRIGPSPLQGYGVFATDNIWTGDLIETVTFIKTQYRTNHLVYPEIKQLLYPYPCTCDTCKHAGRQFVICSGSLQVYNGAKEHKDSHVWFNFSALNRTVKVIASKPINKDEEILVYYGKSYKFYDTEVE
jgi:hypothetical protein